MDKRNNPLGRNPTVIAILVGLFVAQVATLVNVFLHGGPRSFTGVIGGWPGVAYNIVGSIVCLVTLYGIARQGLNVPVGKFVSGLIVEQWGKGILGLIMLVYSTHSILRGGTFPFLAIVLGIGFIWRWFDIRKELNEIRQDLLLLRAIQKRVK
jgi:hypothetical protein